MLRLLKIKIAESSD